MRCGGDEILARKQSGEATCARTPITNLEDAERAAAKLHRDCEADSQPCPLSPAFLWMESSGGWHKCKCEFALIVHASGLHTASLTQYMTPQTRCRNRASVDLQRRL
jgi:hypothetical protein